MMMLVMVLIGKEATFITKNAPVSIYVFANSAILICAITQDPINSGFAKAIEERGIFSRSWCVFELYLILIKVQKNKNKKKGGDVDSSLNELRAAYRT